MRTFFWTATLAFWVLVLLRAFQPAPAAPPQAASAPAATSAAPRFTWKDVARHAKAGDCWMAIDGVVYDLSAYLPEHPADPALLPPWCGRDASEAYRTKLRGRSHSRGADRLLATYRIGALAPER